MTDTAGIIEVLTDTRETMELAELLLVRYPQHPTTGAVLCRLKDARANLITIQAALTHKETT